MVNGRVRNLALTCPTAALAWRWRGKQFVPVVKRKICDAKQQKVWERTISRALDRSELGNP
jgi:hypothetical protein